MAKFCIIFCFLFCVQVSCNSSQPGCTDPLAANFDVSATEDDNSCISDTIFVAPEWTVVLSDQLSETSGLIFWDGFLWTINDDTDTRLYFFNAATGEIAGDYILPGVVNRDWEEISQDEDFIYIGDVGNNRGNRTDLHILRIEKLSLKSGDPSIDTIWFNFSDQQDFAPDGAMHTEFDCEAFVVTRDSIYLFTKQWISGLTTQYALQKIPGSYTAQKRNSFDVRGQVTGATLLENESVLVLCGYTGLMQPFLFLFYDYPEDDFFAGTQKQVNISIPFHQVEGVTTRNGMDYYISNEASGANQIVNLPQKLHHLDLSEFLGEYLKGTREFD